jgi:translation initiation factor IF-1
MSVEGKTGRKIKWVCSCGHKILTNICGKMNATEIVHGPKMWTKLLKVTQL